MKIAVLGADGRAGTYFVDKATSKGHNIRAGIYSQNNKKNTEKITYVRCDASSIEDVTNLIKGQDAVVSLIGHTKNSPADIQARAMINLVKAMDLAGIKRIISLTGTGVRFPQDKIPLYDRFLNLAVKIVDPKRVSDGIAHAEILKNSDLDWTIIRVLKLQNTKPGPFILTEHGPTKLYVSREEVADAIIQVLEKEDFIKKAPILSRT